MQHDLSKLWASSDGSILLTYAFPVLMLPLTPPADTMLHFCRCRAENYVKAPALTLFALEAQVDT